MSTCVYCIARSEAQAIRIANRLYNSGFAPSDISMVHPDRSAARDIGHENATKAPEGATAGVSAGALLGGALGWAAGVGALAIPGFGPLIAVGPILGTLSGAAVGGTMGGIAGALIGLGLPEYEAHQYEGKLREGNILISVHTDNANEAARVRTIMSEERAEDVSSGTESAIPQPHLASRPAAMRR